MFTMAAGSTPMTNAITNGTVGNRQGPNGAEALGAMYHRAAATTAWPRATDISETVSATRRATVLLMADTDRRRTPIARRGDAMRLSRAVSAAPDTTAPSRPHTSHARF